VSFASNRLKGDIAMALQTVNRPIDNVIDIFTGKPLSDLFDHKLIRVAAELDGLEMLYSNSENADKLFSIKILAWGLRRSGEVVGLVPWLDGLVACDAIDDPLNGQWEGYYDQGVDEVFFAAPLHKFVELETAADYYEFLHDESPSIVREIPDTIGTHAVLSGGSLHSITLKEVVSWRLSSDGSMDAMLINESKVLNTPVLPGDDCLYAADRKGNFRYFFQHAIANKLKLQDPDAIAAIALLDES